MTQHELFPVPKRCIKPRRLTVGCAAGDWPRPSTPFLRLRGHWLNDAGFAIGRHVKVEVSQGRLLIEPVD